MVPSRTTTRPHIRRSPVVATRDPEKSDFRFHIMVGIAAGLGLLTLVAAVVLLARETAYADATNADSRITSPASEPPARVVAANPVVAVPEAPTPARPPAPPGTRSLRAQTQAREFRGSVSPPQEAVIAAPGAGNDEAEPAENKAEADEPPADAPAAAEDSSQEKPDETATVDNRASSGRLKRVFGTILRPFRGRRPPAEP